MKKFFFRKRNGAGQLYILLYVFLMFISIVTIYFLDYRKVKLYMYHIDNGVILSALAADVIDLYQYSTYNQIVLDTGENKAYGALTDESSFTDGCTKAWLRAKERFTDAVISNLNLTGSTNGQLISGNSDITSITLNKIVVYNLRGNDVFTCDGNNVIKYPNGRGSLTTKTGDIIFYSGIYIDMTFKIYVLGSYYDLPVKEYVNVLSN